MRHRIGIMQGRLSPPRPERLQIFPAGRWEEEFPRARACNLDAIEWLFEGNHYAENPIFTPAGVARIREVIRESGIRVRSVCCDYLMPHPLHGVSGSEQKRSAEVLSTLIENAASLGVEAILLPVLEEAAVHTEKHKRQLAEGLCEPLTVAESKGISLGLETELPAAEYLDLVQRIDHPRLGVFYDTGNAAAQGYDIVSDLAVLGDRLVGVHVKDRPKAGKTVLLGKGDADFDGFFRDLNARGFSGPITIQAPFGNDFLETARVHAEFVRSRLS